MIDLYVHITTSEPTIVVVVRPDKYTFEVYDPSVSSDPLALRDGITPAQYARVTQSLSAEVAAGVVNLLGQVGRMSAALAPFQVDDERPTDLTETIDAPADAP